MSANKTPPRKSYFYDILFVAIFIVLALVEVPHN